VRSRKWFNHLIKGAFWERRRDSSIKIENPPVLVFQLNNQLPAGIPAGNILVKDLIFPTDSPQAQLR